MAKFEWADLAMLAGPIGLLLLVIILMKVIYSTKSFAVLPSVKPKFCLFPKYVVTLQLNGSEPESELSSRLANWGFRERPDGSNRLTFHRGSAVGDFSIKIAKLIATASRPVKESVELYVSYGVPLGVAFDTGDLWQVCHELQQKLDALADQDDANSSDDSNPYQSPAD